MKTFTKTIVCSCTYSTAFTAQANDWQNESKDAWIDDS